MRTGQSPRVKKIIPSKMTSPERVVINNKSQKTIKPTSSTTLTSKKIIPQSSTSKISTSRKQGELVTYNDRSDPQHLTKNQRAQKLFLEELKMYYDGNLLNGKFQGPGVLYETSNQNYIYKGNWVEGTRQGYGHYIYPDRSEYSGQWKNNEKYGKGIYKNIRGEQYDGDWVHNKRQGMGKMTLDGGVTLQGEWKNDQFAQGRVRYSNQDEYKGALKNYQRYGFGEYEFERSADKYTGNYSGNQKQNGSYTYRNGDIYEGSFRNDRKQGTNCRYLWNNSKYQLINAQFISDKAIHGTIYDKQDRKNVKTF